MGRRPDRWQVEGKDGGVIVRGSLPFVAERCHMSQADCRWFWQTGSKMVHGATMHRYRWQKVDGVSDFVELRWE